MFGPSKDMTKTLISIHQDATGRTFDLESPIILAQAERRRAREFLEAWYSKADAINCHTYFEPIYLPIRNSNHA